MYFRIRARDFALAFSAVLVTCPIAPAMAQVIDHPRDDGLVKIPEVNVDVPRVAPPVESTTRNPDDPTNLNDSDLKANAGIASFILSVALQRQDWNTVRRILAFYDSIPGHDPMMRLYAGGALARHDGHHGKAIADYREMLATDPSLPYVRFDLAAMLFEDKQYAESRRLFQMLQHENDIANGVGATIGQYLQAIRKQTGWTGTLRIGYTYNDNTNTASADPNLYLFGLPFTKDKDSLPKGGNGVAYFGSASRDYNISGNHFLSVGGSLQGDQYWDNSVWSDITATAQVGYKYRDIKSWFSVQPQVSELWLGGRPYRGMVGVGVEYGRWFGPKWQAVASYAWYRKTYDDSGLHIYNGDLHAGSLTLVHAVSRHTVLFGGLTFQRDLLRAKDESSSRYGVALGAIRAWNNGLNVRLDARYAYRAFDAISFWDLTRKRHDNEYQVNLSVGDSKIKIAGLTPRLIYQYLDVGSSIPSIYAHKGNQLIVALERNF